MWVIAIIAIAGIGLWMLSSSKKTGGEASGGGAAGGGAAGGLKREEPASTLDTSDKTGRQRDPEVVAPRLFSASRAMAYGRVLGGRTAGATSQTPSTPPTGSGRVRINDLILMYKNGELSIDLSGNGTLIVPVETRRPVTPDEMGGGIDIHIDPSHFWECVLRIRKASVIEPAYPELIGWKNRMPRDNGKAHRRWYTHKNKLRFSNGDIWEVDEWNDGCYLAAPYALNIHDSIYGAIEEYTSRRWSLVLRGYRGNEDNVPGDGSFTQGFNYAQPIFNTLWMQTFLNTDYCIFVKKIFPGSNTGDSSDMDTLQSTIVAMYAPITTNNARSFRAQAKAFIYDMIIKVVTLLLTSFAGRTIQDALADSTNKAAQWILDVVNKFRDFYADHQALVNSLKSYTVGTYNKLSNDLNTDKYTSVMRPAQIEGMKNWASNKISDLYDGVSPYKTIVEGGGDLDHAAEVAAYITKIVLIEPQNANFGI